MGIKVSLIAHTPNPEEVVSKAGKLCYSKVGVDEIAKKQSDEDIARFVKMLVDMGHESPLEHISFTFAVEGISRACSHQLVRHRLASYSQQSQRYVDLKDTFVYVVPPEIEVDVEAYKLYIEVMDLVFEAYLKLSSRLKDKYISEGMPNRMASKKAIEDARYVLPNACETKLVFTMNARTLLHFLNKRCCDRSQWEIRQMAHKMLSEVRKVCPSLFKKAGADCISKGICNEGDMCCGKIDLINRNK